MMCSNVKVGYYTIITTVIVTFIYYKMYIIGDICTQKYMYKRIQVIVFKR